MHAIRTVLFCSALLAPLAAQNTCSSTTIGPGCGPTLTVSFEPINQSNNARIRVTGNGLFPSGVSMMAWGDTQLPGLQLPFGGCPLYTNFIWGHIVNPDSTGSFTWSRSWPASVQGQYYIQLGSLTQNNGALQLISSNCELASCQ